MKNQIQLDFPKDKKEISLLVKLDYADIKALKSGMEKVGETNKSSFVRRLIHEHK